MAQGENPPNPGIGNIDCSYPRFPSYIYCAVFVVYINIRISIYKVLALDWTLGYCEENSGAGDLAARNDR